MLTAGVDMDHPRPHTPRAILEDSSIEQIAGCVGCSVVLIGMDIEVLTGVRKGQSEHLNMTSRRFKH